MVAAVVVRTSLRMADRPCTLPCTPLAQAHFAAEASGTAAASVLGLETATTTTPITIAATTDAGATPIMDGDIIRGAGTAGTTILQTMTRGTRIRIRTRALIRLRLPLLTLRAADCSAICRR